MRNGAPSRLFLRLILSFSFIGCGSSSGDSEPPPSGGAPGKGGESGSGGGEAASGGAAGAPTTGGAGGTGGRPTTGGDGSGGTAGDAPGGSDGGGAGGTAPSDFVDEITGHWDEIAPYGYFTLTSTVAQSWNGGHGNRGEFSASFYDSSDGFCTFEVVSEGCWLQQCGAWVTRQHAWAGMLELRVGGQMERQKSRNATAGVYQISQTVTAPWRDGDEALSLLTQALTFESPVGTVPPLRVDFPAPARVTLTAPPLWGDTHPDRQPLEVRRGEGLPLSWDGQSSGSLKVTLSAQSSASDRRFAVCRFDPSLGHAEMPPALLERLPSGSGILTVVTAQERIARSGDWKVLFAAQMDAVTPSGERPAVAVTLQ